MDPNAAGEAGYSRAERAGEQMHRVLATLIDRELKDPRLGRVTVSGLRLSRDFRHARVYITPAAGSDAAASVAVLRRAAGFLRHELATHLRLRVVPALEFRYDPTLDRAMHIERLLAASASASATEDGRVTPRGSR